jgi:hypothetical protein
MNPSSLMRHRRDLFVASRNPFAARWSTLSPLSLAPTPLAIPAAASPDDADPEEEEEEEDLDDDDDDEFDEDEDADDEVDEDSEQTAEPEGQFPNAPDALKDAERPGAPQNRHGDRGGVS